MKRLKLYLLVLICMCVLINLRAQNQKPVANAGTNKSVYECGFFSIMGSGTDADHDPLTYKWIVPVEINNGSIINTKNLFLSDVSVIANKVFPFILIVNDGIIDSDPDTILITIKDMPNVAPVIQTINFPNIDRSGKTVNLSASGNDGNCGDNLQYHWVANSNISLLYTNNASTSFIAPLVSKPVDYNFTISVSDGVFSIDSTITITIVPNSPPIAEAGPDTIITSCQSLYLNNLNNSTDPTNDPLTLFWEQPAESPFNLESNSITPRYPVKNPTVYYFKLTVFDGELESTDSMKVTVIPEFLKPKVDNLYPTDTFYAHGREMMSIDGFAYDSTNTRHNLTYEWIFPNELTKNVDLSDRSSITFYVKPVDRESYFPLKMVAKNCELTSDTLIWTVVVSDSTLAKTPPIIGISDRTIESGKSEYFNPHLNYDKLDSISYEWQSLNGIAITNNHSENPLWTAPFVPKDSLFYFTLKVNDGTFEVTDTFYRKVLSKRSIYKMGLDSCYMGLKHIFGQQYQDIYYLLDDRVLDEYVNNYQVLFIKNNNKARNFYGELYSCAFTCNILLKNLESSDFDKETLDEWTGELKFLRGLYNFYLFSCFRNVPVVTNSLKTSILNTRYPIKYTLDTFYVSTATDFKNAIVDDLSEAIKLLPQSKNTSAPEIPISWSARALLGKMYLYMNEWDKAAEQFQSIISSGTYSLSMPKAKKPIDYINAYESNFSMVDLPASDGTFYKAEFNNESLFEVNYTDIFKENVYIPGYLCSGNLIAQYYSPHQLSFRNIEALPPFVDQFEKKGVPDGFAVDPRSSASFYFEGDTMDFRPGSPYSVPYKFNINSHQLGFNSFYKKTVGIKKHFYPVYSKNESAYNSPNNWRLIRFADVLLMYAEAQFHLGKIDSSLKAINKVRNRAGMDALTIVTPQAIMHERDVELGFECVRFHDLVRWSLLPQPWVKIDTIDKRFVKGKNEYLPAPQFLRYPSILLSNNTFPDNSVKGTFIGTIKDQNLKDPVKFGFMDGIPNNNDYFIIHHDSLYVNCDMSSINSRTFTVYLSSRDNYLNIGSQAYMLYKQSFVSIPEISEVNNEYRIYPNPSDGLININSNVITNDPVFLKIFDLQGRMLFEKHYPYGLSMEQLDLKGLSEGMLLISILNGSNCEVHKVIIKK